MKLRPTAIALGCVISYLTYHAIAGEQGLSRWTSLQREVADLKVIHEDKLERRDELADQIARLYPESLDKDFIEEIARTRFHFVHPEETIIDPPSLSSQLPENEELFALSNQ